MHISAVKTAWEEGEGLDMEGYTDLTYDQTGSNWTNRAGSTAWVKTGGDYFVDASSSFTASFVSAPRALLRRKLVAKLAIGLPPPPKSVAPILKISDKAIYLSNKIYLILAPIC